MSVRLFFRQEITVKRLTRDTGNANKEAYVAQSGSTRGCLMQLAPNDAMLSEGNPAKSATLFFEENGNIVDGDLVTIDGTEYTVRGVAMPMGFKLGVRFKKAIVEKMNS
jgi:hypothetical protein